MFKQNEEGTDKNEKPVKKPVDCQSFDEGKCNHEAFKGAACPQYSDCILWGK